VFQLKSLSQEGIHAALKKAERYRLLNEPWEAESICLDILEVDRANQDALVLLILARTDQFVSGAGADIQAARELLPRLHGEYDRAYYAGIICERRASALLHRDAMGAGTMAYDWFRQAMHWYEQAEAIRPAGNDDPILRWNTCARALMRHAHVRPAVAEDFHPLLE
jgi:hypothetical protein